MVQGGGVLGGHFHVATLASDAENWIN
jgi:hypothetical protein